MKKATIAAGLCLALCLAAALSAQAPPPEIQSPTPLTCAPGDDECILWCLETYWGDCEMYENMCIGACGLHYSSTTPAYSACVTSCQNTANWCALTVHLGCGPL